MATWISFHPLVLALYSLLQMLKIFQMKKSNELSKKQEISKCQEEMTLTLTCDLLQPSTRSRKVEEVLNAKKDKKVKTSFRQGAQAFGLLREDLLLKKQLLQKFEESDKKL